MKFFIHIGYPKTASTYLQLHIFSKNNNINFLGRPSIVWEEKLSVIEKMIFKYDDKEFENELPNILKTLKDINFSKEKINLISNETFLRSSRHELPNGADILKNISRLNIIFSNFGKVFFFVVIRNHTDMLYSSYIQFKKSWSAYSITFETLKNHLKNKNLKKLFVLEDFKYFKIYNYICTNFGEDKVKLLFYEDINHSHFHFLDQLFKFFQINFDYNNFLNKTENQTKGKIKSWKFSSKINFVFMKFINLIRNKKKLRIDHIKIFFVILFTQKHFKKYDYFNKNEFIKINGLIKDYYRDDLVQFENKIKKKLIRYKYL
ncbi:hypothetical protein OA322_00130 [bacterium]|nr:hypothetical protein [bacterium]